jgi:quinolinate synthase
MGTIRASLPDEYREVSENDLVSRILSKRREFGKRLVILTHHYQRMEIVRIGDYVGDSYGLAKIAAQSPDAEIILFCGVRFMAEAARILCRPGQRVFLANAEAGCPMANMAPAEQVYQAWDLIDNTLGPGHVTPISYMNSTAELKAFTGLNGGLICTSSNADAAFKWAFARSEKLFFFPDQHLGRNTARKMGFNNDQMIVFDPRSVLNGIDLKSLERARVILWYGSCYVHTKFLPDHIDIWRSRVPSVKIVVHPECSESVVEKADAVGSTSFIVKYVENLPPGSTIAIGTELNLVHRLAETHKDKRIFELSDDSCPVCSNMFRTSLVDVCYVLENLEIAEEMIVVNDIASNARLALERMLEIGS